MKILKRNLLIVTLFLQLFACGTTPKSESDYYNEMRDGTVYRAYQKISIEVMKPVIKEYDKKLAEENKPQAGKTHVHALLGFIWLAVAEPKYALAESEYAVEQARDSRNRYAALTILSLAMYQQGWPYLGKQKSVEARRLVTTHELSNSYSNILMFVHVVGSALALQEGNIPFVASEVREFGKLSNQNWIVGLGDITDEAYSGSQAKTLAKLEKLKNDPGLSEYERNGVDKVIHAAKVGGKDMGTTVSKAVVSVVLDTAIRKSPLTPLVVQELPKKYQKKLAKYL